MYFLVRFIHKGYGFIITVPLLVLVLICQTSSAQAQAYSTPKYRLLHYTSENGLPQNSVGTMQFDKAGNLWFGTQGGPVCYDGFSFKTIFTEKTSQRILGTYKDWQGDIWLVDNLKNGYKVNEANTDLLKPFLPSQHTPCNYKWLKLNNRDSSCIEDAIYNELSYPYPYFNKPNCIYYYSNIEKVLLCYTGNKLPVVKLKKNPPVTGVVDGKLLVKFDDGNMRCYTLNKYSNDIKVITGIKGVTNPAKIGSFLIFQSDSITLSIYNNTIYRLHLRQDTLVFTQLISGIPSIEGISDVKYQAPTDTYFISSAYTGLYIIQPTSFSVKTKTISKSLPDFAYKSNAIYNQIELEDGSIIDNLGVCFPSNNSEPFLLVPNALPKPWYKDRFGYIWYQNATTKELYQCDKKLQVTHTYILAEKEDIKAIEQIQNDEYIIITPSKIFLLKDKVLEPKIDISKIAVGYNWIEKTARIDSTNIVMVLTETGLYQLNLSNYTLHKMPATPEADFRGIFKSRNGHYWIGTYGKGFYLLQNNQLIALPLDRKQNLLNANAILDDVNGFLWISTNNGLFQVKETDLLAYAQKKVSQIYYHNYDKSYGFNTNEFNGGTNSPAIALQNGHFSFSSLNGIVDFDPTIIKPLLPNQPISLNDVKVNDTIYTVKDSTIFLKPDFRLVDININSPYVGHPYNMQLETRIIGYDEEWQKIELPNHIKITYLPKGEYILEVRKLAGFGENNYIIQRLIIQVAKPWYLSWWAYAIAFLGFVGLVLVIMKLRLKQLQRQKKTLELIVDKRTKELLENNEKLIRSNRQNEIVHSILLHDIKGPLKFIAEVSETLGENWKTLNETTKHKLSTEIAQASKETYHFVFDFLGWVKFKKEKDLQQSPCNLQSLVAEIIQTKKHERKLQSAIVVYNNIDGHITLQTHKQVLQIILTNIFDNAIKYTMAGSISFTCQLTANNAIIACTDTGQGMTAQKINQLLSNENLYESVTEDSFQLGFIFIRELLPLLNGQFTIDATVGKGTTVIIILPL